MPDREAKGVAASIKDGIDMKMQYLSALPLYEDEVARATSHYESYKKKLVSELNMPEEARAYVLSMRKWCGYFYISAAWVEDDQKRKDLGYFTCMHLFACKLLDDIIDNDTQCPHAYLAVGGAATFDHAYGLLARLQASGAFFDGHSDRWNVMWRHHLSEPSLCVSDFADWRDKAFMRAGYPMWFYADFALRFTQRESLLPSIKDWFRAIGEIWVAFDDFKDRDLENEADTNLYSKIRRKEITKEEVVEALEANFTLLKEEAKKASPCVNYLPFARRLLDYVNYEIQTMKPLAEGC